MNESLYLEGKRARREERDVESLKPLVLMALTSIDGGEQGKQKVT